MANIVICEPWFGGSHRAWAKGLQEHSRHNISILGLPDQAWRWRLRGSAPWFAEMLSRQPQPDLLLVSGLVDAAALRGLIGRPVPMVVYMHESQGAYPGAEWDLESALRNWQSMLAADRVWFNSQFHLDTALAQVDRLYGEMPWEQLLDGPEDLLDKCHVVYPGVDLEWADTVVESGRPSARILWPHRWESDKQPEVFERALHRLDEAGVKFEVVLAGFDGQQSSPVRQRIIDRYGSRVTAGPFDLDTYRHELLGCDLVVSCTGHEFFGIAVVEALAAGCAPVLPNDYSYPEVVGQANAHLLYEAGSFGAALEAAATSGQRHRVDVARFDWTAQVVEYDRRFSTITG